MIQNSKSPLFLLVSILVSQAGIAASHASAVLRLSDSSSDQTLPSDLDATFDFSLSGSTLLLTVTNETSIPDSKTSTGFGFDIVDVFFNAPEEITGILLDADSLADGWVITTNERADGFGVFDFGLLSELGNDDGEIAPGESRQFELTLSSSGPFAESEFTTTYSTIPPGSRPALAAAKFTNGPNDDSAFGAVIIPEPATLLLLLSGAAFAVRRHSRSRA